MPAVHDIRTIIIIYVCGASRACVFGRKFYVRIMPFDTFSSAAYIRVVRIQRIKIKLQKFPITLALISLYYSFPVTDKLTHTLSNPHSLHPRAPLTLSHSLSLSLFLDGMWTCRSVLSKLDLKHVCDCIGYVHNKNNTYSSSVAYICSV